MMLAVVAALVAQVGAPEVMFVESGFGFSQVDLNTGAILKTVPNDNPTLDVYGMTHDGSRLVAIDRGQYINVPLDEFVRIHPADGALDPIGLTGFVWNISTLEIDPTTGIYQATHGGDLYMIDPGTGKASLVGPIQGLKPFDCICGLGIDPQGKALGVGVVGYALYSIDLATATATHLGDLPFQFGVVTDAAVDLQGRLFVSWSASGPQFQRGIYLVDTKNLTVSLFTKISSGISGLACGPATSETTYCSAKANSIGCKPTLLGSGVASPTAASGYEVIGSNVANQTHGRLLYSLAGPAALPFAGGTWCLASPVQGTPIASSAGSPKPIQDCSGSWTVDLNTIFWQKPGPQPGNTVFCQWIGRDRGFAAPGNYALTSALEFTLLP